MGLVAMPHDFGNSLFLCCSFMFFTPCAPKRRRSISCSDVVMTQAWINACPSESRYVMLAVDKPGQSGWSAAGLNVRSPIRHRRRRIHTTHVYGHTDCSCENTTCSRRRQND